MLAALAGCQPGTNPKLLGVWRPVSDVAAASGRTPGTIEFVSGGEVHVSGDTSAFKDFEFLKILADFGATPGLDDIQFRSLSDKEIEVVADYSELLEPLKGGGPEPSRDEVQEAMKMLKPKERITFQVSDSELTLTGAAGKPMKLQRVP